MVALCAIFMLETKSPSRRDFRFKRPLIRIFLEKSFLEDLCPLKRSKVLPGGLLKWPPSSQKGFDLLRGLLGDQGEALDQAPRGPRAARGRGRAPPCARKCHLPILERGELRMWGPHFIAPHGTEGYRCITCARVADHKSASYALRTLPCSSRYGLAGPFHC